MKTNKKMVKKDTLFVVASATLVVGFILGVLFTVYKLDSVSQPLGETADTAHNHGNLSQEQIQLLHKLKADLKADPKNIQAWIRLGHLYYDSGEAEQAIGAYNESLKLHEGDANLWTDLGVMYRRVKQFDKAIEMFDKAISLDPSHEPSRLNKGIVLIYDFGRNKEAIEVWKELLTINPDAKAANGESVAEFMEHIKKDLAVQTTNTGEK